MVLGQSRPQGGAQAWVRPTRVVSSTESPERGYPTSPSAGPRGNGPPTGTPQRPFRRSVCLISALQPQDARRGPRRRAWLELRTSREVCLPGRGTVYSRSPLRRMARIFGEAIGTHMAPLLPSATLPSSCKKLRAALRLRRVVRCPQRVSIANSWFRLSGPGASRSANRMYSMVARVGFAPGRANCRGGARVAIARRCGDPALEAVISRVASVFCTTGS
jgi:hypothetical protein